MPSNQIHGAPRVQGHPTQHLIPDGFFGGCPHGTGFKRGLPSLKPVIESKIGVKKLSARPQYPVNLVEKSPEIRITMRSFDVYNNVEGPGFKRQARGIALLELEVRDDVTRSTEFDAGPIEIQPHIRSWFEITDQIGGPSPMPAAYFEHVLTGQSALGGHGVIKLNAIPVGFIGSGQRNPERRIVLKSVIQEKNVILPQSSGEKGIPPLPDSLANASGQKQ